MQVFIDVFRGLPVFLKLQHSIQNNHMVPEIMLDLPAVFRHLCNPLVVPPCHIHLVLNLACLILCINPFRCLLNDPYINKIDGKSKNIYTDIEEYGHWIFYIHVINGNQSAAQYNEKDNGQKGHMDITVYRKTVYHNLIDPGFCNQQYREYNCSYGQYAGASQKGIRHVVLIKITSPQKCKQEVCQRCGTQSAQHGKTEEKQFSIPGTMIQKRKQ